jgi:hypothetical protein
LAVKHYGHWKDRVDGLRKRLEELNQHKRKEVDRVGVRPEKVCSKENKPVLGI